MTLCDLEVRKTSDKTKGKVSYILFHFTTSLLPLLEDVKWVHIKRDVISFSFFSFFGGAINVLWTTNRSVLSESSHVINLEQQLIVWGDYSTKGGPRFRTAISNDICIKELPTYVWI